MKRARSLAALILGISICSAQRPSAYVEIRVPAGVRSEAIFVRYQLDDDFGGWVEPHPEISSYFISAIRKGLPATRFRALVYAPGCAIQTVDLPRLALSVQQYSFVCQPLPNFRLTGNLSRPDRLDGHQIGVKVKYVAQWSQRFLNVSTDIPIAGTQYIFADGSFQLSLPDLSADPLAGSSDHPGELQIAAIDRATGKIFAHLVPVVPSLRTRFGGLQIRPSYPEAVEFTPCPAHGAELHDTFGFAIRGTVPYACEQ